MHSTSSLIMPSQRNVSPNSGTIQFPAYPSPFSRHLTPSPYSQLVSLSPRSEHDSPSTCSRQASLSPYSQQDSLSPYSKQTSRSPHSQQVLPSPQPLEASPSSVSQHLPPDVLPPPPQTQRTHSGSPWSCTVKVSSRSQEPLPSAGSSVASRSIPSSSLATSNQDRVDVDACDTRGGDWKGGRGKKRGMLGMVLSVVGDCMKAVEPAQRNLIEDPELVLEASEESGRSQGGGGSQLRDAGQGGRSEGQRVSQQHHHNGASNNLYIIDEFRGVEEDFHYCPQYTPGVTSHSLDVANVHVNNNNHHHHHVAAKKKGKVVKESTSRRPLVLVFSSHRGSSRTANKRFRSSSGGYCLHTSP
ncbi:uncharacterized protein LOC121878679 [Homarus americanus]|uniref:uncharacterized protein LOC121878679 n=1 Tax=Homarus americanus TaxID=6706 RepID=UPI001C4475C6|nr:uncharacterized protein LOC121878679 [Homarus americanus]